MKRPFFPETEDCACILLGVKGRAEREIPGQVTDRKRKNAKHFSRGQGSLTLARSSCVSWSRGARNPRPERFRPLSDENFSIGKVRELRAYPLRRKNVRTFFRLYNAH